MYGPSYKYELPAPTATAEMRREAGLTQHSAYGCKGRLQGRRFKAVRDPQVVFHAKVAACSNKDITPSPYRIRHLRAGNVQGVAHKAQSCRLRRPTVSKSRNVEYWEVVNIEIRRLLIATVAAKAGTGGNKQRGRYQFTATKSPTPDRSPAARKECCMCSIPRRLPRHSLCHKFLVRSTRL